MNRRPRPWVIVLWLPARVKAGKVPTVIYVGLKTKAPHGWTSDLKRARCFGSASEAWDAYGQFFGRSDDVGIPYCRVNVVRQEDLSSFLEQVQQNPDNAGHAPGTMHLPINVVKLPESSRAAGLSAQNPDSSGPHRGMTNMAPQTAEQPLSPRPPGISGLRRMPTPSADSDCPVEKAMRMLHRAAGDNLRDLIGKALRTSETIATTRLGNLWELAPTVETLQGLQNGSLELMDRGKGFFQATARNSDSKKDIIENIRIRPGEGQRIVKLLNVIGIAHAMLIEYAEAQQLRTIQRLLADIRLAQQADRYGELESCAKELCDILLGASEEATSQQRLFHIKRELYKLQEQYLQEALHLAENYSPTKQPFIDGLRLNKNPRDLAGEVAQKVCENVEKAHKAARLQLVILSATEHQEESQVMAARYTETLKALQSKMRVLLESLPYSSSGHGRTEERIVGFLSAIQAAVESAGMIVSQVKGDLRLRFEDSQWDVAAKRSEDALG